MDNDPQDMSEADLPAGFSPVIEEEEVEIEEVLPLVDETDPLATEEDEIDDLQIYLMENSDYE